MFDALSDRLDGIFSRLRSRGRLSEKDIDEVAREIRVALLEADVNVRVVRAFIERIKEKAVGAELAKNLNPAQQFIKIVHDELVETLGGQTGKLTMSSKPPTVLMLAGLQGSGKTTAAGKLAVALEVAGVAAVARRCRPPTAGRGGAAARARGSRRRAVLFGAERSRHRRAQRRSKRPRASAATS